jgi:hypothetical protein
VSVVSQKRHAVAILHARDAVPVAARLRGALEARSIPCWLSEDPGTPSCLSPSLEAVEDSWMCVFLLTAGSASDVVFGRAIAHAVARTRWIFGIRLDHTRVPRTLEYYAGALQVFDAISAPVDLIIGLVVEDAERIFGELGAQS